MLSKSNRLKTLEFDKVFNFGKKIQTPEFFIKYLENNLPYSRFAVVVSKKKVASAFKRNLFKRKIFNAIKKTNILSTSKDYIFIPNNKDVLEKKEKEIILIIDKIRLK